MRYVDSKDVILRCIDKVDNSFGCVPTTMNSIEAIVMLMSTAFNAQTMSQIAVWFNSGVCH